MPEQIGRVVYAPAEAIYQKHMPEAYRLSRHKDGTLVLQGAFFWSNGEATGHEWRDIPTVEAEGD